jgi:hypothetical protein
VVSALPLLLQSWKAKVIEFCCFHYYLKQMHGGSFVAGANIINIFSETKRKNFWSVPKKALYELHGQTNVS